MEETPCVSGVVASVPGCMLPSTPCVSEGVCVTETLCMSETPRVSVPACVSGMVCVKETARVSERPCVRGTACVRSLCKGDDGGHARTCSRISRCECDGMESELRNTQVCVDCMETKMASDNGQRPSSGCSCIGNRAGLARRRA